MVIDLHGSVGNKRTEPFKPINKLLVLWKLLKYCDNIVGVLIKNSSPLKFLSNPNTTELVFSLYEGCTT